MFVLPKCPNWFVIRIEIWNAYVLPLLGEKLLIDELQIKSQCSLDYGIPNDVDLDIIFCQKGNCCSIGALPMVTPDCSESDFFTNSQLGYCADFDFGFDLIKGNCNNSVAEIYDFIFKTT